MITDSFSRDRAIISPEDVYKETGEYFKVCICTFSPAILAELLARFTSRQVAEVRTVKGPVPIYAFDADGAVFGAFSLSIGSALAGTDIIDINRVAGADTFIVFGSAGALDSKAIGGRFVIPTAAYRDEGFSYHYAPPADYIDIPGSLRTAEIFKEINAPYVMGRTWTTDAFYRETRAELEKRVSEGCLTVEMELAGIQAACSFHGFKLYAFLQAGDVLDGEEYDISGLHGANHDLAKLKIALEIAKRV